LPAARQRRDPGLGRYLGQGPERQFKTKASRPVVEGEYVVPVGNRWCMYIRKAANGEAYAQLASGSIWRRQVEAPPNRSFVTYLRRMDAWLEHSTDSRDVRCNGLKPQTGLDVYSYTPRGRSAPNLGSPGPMQLWYLRWASGDLRTGRLAELMCACGVLQ
jgi:hypothetical protein